MRYTALLLLALMVYSCSKPTKFRMIDPGFSGIDFNNKITETDSFNVMSYEYIYNGAGVGTGDLNNDGLNDLVFAGNQVSSKVYINLGGFKFRDITSNFAGLTNNQWFSGVSLADVNNDGWLDVYLTSTKDTDPEKCKNRLWINAGSSDPNGPFFTEMAEQYGIAEKGQSVASAFFDYDLDGDLDLYVLNNTMTQRMNTFYRAKVTDGTAANNDKLYRNNGNGTFTDVTIEAGIVFEGFGLGLAISDFNKDGYPDIYVSNDYISNDLLYINQRNGTFRNEIRNYLSYQTKSSMGNDVADVNNDGNPDIITQDMLPEYYYKKKQTINGYSYQIYMNNVKYDYEIQYVRNMLHLHGGFMNGEMLPFDEVGQMAGVSATEWNFSPLFADFDNDGDKDLFVANGYPRDLTDKDWTFFKVKVYGSIANEQQVIEMAPAIKVQNFALENIDGVHFVKRNKEWLPDYPSYSYGAVYSDLDNDGDLDYVTNNINDYAFVQKNLTVEKGGKKARYLRVKLLGKSPNTMGIGAKAELWYDGSYQYLENYLTRGYASSTDPVLHFGLKNAERIDSLKITWPATGYTSLLRDLEVNRVIEVNENGSLPHSVRKPMSPEKLMFTRSDSFFDYTHEQLDYVDFGLNQKIIPHKFSQIGPVFASGDLNSDGLADILIGSTNNTPTKAYMRKGSGFVPGEVNGLTKKKKYSESDLAIFDADNDGDNDVVAVAGAYENTEESEYRHCIYVNDTGSFMRIELPVTGFPASVVRPCDFDHDGDIDIFIGARVKRDMYPYSNYSWLLLNDKGNFTADSTFRFNLGMVTDAVWSDFDGDGWEDLLVAREWNSVAVLRNMNGKNMEYQLKTETEKHLGIWYSITAGDFDGDGDDDYIAGNLGENHRFTVNEKYPIYLYCIDLDLDGIIDPIMTGYWPDKDDRMQEYPVNYCDELRTQSSYFAKIFENYKDFSYQTFTDMMTRDVLKRVDFKLTVNTTSSYVIWNDKGSFRFEKLALPLQFSPVKKMIVKDLNADGFPDVLLGGNDYTYDVSTGYYDSNKGFVLMSRGKAQGFDVMSPSKSGLLLKGMVESLLWFDGDTPLVVAGINRSKAIVYQKTGK